MCAANGAAMRRCTACSSGELAEALKAADIPLSSQRWTKADCTQILAIVETIPPADTDLIEED
ncbi:MAG: hypothetical protein EBR82_74450 [Caulobacteraceae bacterium]|nr:hypothetical protein [Caulobacteraceae bacterium]